MSGSLRVLLAEPYSNHPPRIALLGLKQAIDSSDISIDKTEIINVTDQLHLLVRQADVLVFSLSNPIELESLFHFLTCAKLPLKRQNRTSEMPIVVAGGMGLANPEPLGEFLDAVVVGSGYEPLLSFLRIISEFGRASVVYPYESVSNIAGLYIPAITETTYTKDGKIADLTNSFRLNNVSSSSIYTYASKVSENEAVLVPDIGCKHKCSFCTLSFWFNYNSVSLNDILLAIDDLSEQGVTQIKINSATASQYPNLLEILEHIRSKGMTVAVGSVRIDKIDNDILRGLSGIHSLSLTQYLYRRPPKNGCPSLTFGIECGSDRLLRLLNKSITIREIKDGILRVTQNGITNIGEYFMIGIPTEREEDIRGIADLITFTYKCVAPFDGEVFVKITPLVPTPNTPMQRVEILSISEYKEKLSMIKQYLLCELGSSVLEHSVHIDSLPPEALLFETIAFRGDQRMGKVLEAICNNGNIGKEVTEEDVERELKSADLPNLSFFRRRIPKEEIAPWHFLISTSVLTEEEAYLKREKEHE